LESNVTTSNPFFKKLGGKNVILPQPSHLL
jgi:hypothetical protein